MFHYGYNQEDKKTYELFEKIILKKINQVKSEVDSLVKENNTQIKRGNKTKLNLSLFELPKYIYEISCI